MNSIHILGLLLACNEPATEQNETIEDVSDIPVPSDSIEEDTAAEEVQDILVTTDYAFDDADSLLYLSLIHI